MEKTHRSYSDADSVETSETERHRRALLSQLAKEEAETQFQEQEDALQAQMRKEEQEARQREEALQTQLRKVTQQKKMAALKAQIEVYSEDRPRISSSSPHGSEPSIPDSFRTSLVDPPPPPATASIGSPPGTLPLDTLARPDISGEIVGQLTNQTRSVLLGGENVGLNAILPAGPSSSGPDSIRNTSPTIRLPCSITGLPSLF